MRVTHTLSRALGAAALAASLATTGLAHAQEAGTGAPTARGPGYRVVAPPGDLPAPPSLVGPARRMIESEVVDRSGRLYLRGDVQGWFGKVVRVQRKECETCSWRGHAVIRTGRKGVFQAVITAPRRGSTFWRAKVRAGGGYARSFSATWETYFG